MLIKNEILHQFPISPKDQSVHKTNPFGLFGTKMQRDGFTERLLHHAVRSLAEKKRLPDKNNSKEWLHFKMIITTLNC